MAHGKPLAYCYDKEQEAATTLWTWWKITGRVTILPSPEGFKRQNSITSRLQCNILGSALDLLTSNFPASVIATAL